ncbi:MAG: response regulator [Gammaproteobacteria bacterium]|nr:response regulator [Gammaproteobacteria bacterium]
MDGANEAADEAAAHDEIRALRERVSSLSSAILRVTASLRVRTVLQEAIDGARALTGARYGFVVTVNDDNVIREVVSSGFTDEELDRLIGWQDGPRLFERLRDLPEPLRLTDFPAFVRSQGFSPELMLSDTFHGTPMRRGDRYEGHFFVAGKRGAPAFTAEDEELLTLFASQAAVAIANARAHRAERRASARLEALVETSPVGVVVFDARNLRPVLVNRASRRIVESLRMPGRPLEELLGVVGCRFADGREIGLAGMSVPEAISNARMLRAEEVELFVPDGRSVTTLINVTPIHRPGGKRVASVVVTLQDLEPLRELERQRASFLGMVSHELRVPLAAVRGSAVTLLEDAAQLDPAEMREFHRIIHDQAGHMRGLIGDLLDAGRIEAGTLSVSPEPSDAAALIDRARTTFVRGGGRHAVLIDLPPDLQQVMADRRRIAQVLTNLLTNAAAHSPGTTPIRVSAEPAGVHVAFSVADEGSGMSSRELTRLFRRYPGGVSPQRRGAGLGLAICKGLVEAHGGRIRAESDGPGRGSRFTFTVPVADGGLPDAEVKSAGAAEGQPEPARVLVVDDDPETLRYVRDALVAAGYAALVTGDPQDLPRILAAEKPDLVILDLVLPSADGIELLTSVAGLARLPVVFISVYGRDETVARALAAGAADYIVKPFSPTELTARVGAALRRAARPGPFVLGDLAMDHDKRLVTVAGRKVPLTPTEYDLLRALALGAGRVVSYRELLERVWPGRELDQLDLVRNFVKQLRAKLGEDAADPRWIFNERGVGYRMPRHGSAPAARASRLGGDGWPSAGGDPPRSRTR